MSRSMHGFTCCIRSCCVLSLVVGHNGVEGDTSLSKEEEKELENQLKLINKPAVKTIQVLIPSQDQRPYEVLVHST